MPMARCLKISTAALALSVVLVAADSPFLGHWKLNSDKSKLTAGLLHLFLGGFGVGRFYLGYTGIGLAQIAVTFLTLGIGGIWPLIDAIMMLTGNVRDAQGRTLRD